MFKKWLTKKLSQPDIERLCRAEATTESELVLIVHSDDMAFEHYFPNRHKANTEMAGDIDVHVNKSYASMPIEDGVYDAVVCTGLLEHLEEPEKVMREFYRVLKPGGKVVISASFAFSNHNAPVNFFHFTVEGLALVFERTGFTTNNINPSCKPFRTIGILLQRICYQAKFTILLKVPVLLIAKLLPYLDKLIKEDYGGIERKNQVRSSLYSNVQGVGLKL
jgi:SAM-dependent methyltransferase